MQRLALFIALLALPLRAQLPPPPVIATFPSNTTTDPDLFPADAAGAVGPNHVVGVTNAGVVVQSRAGNVLQATTLSQLWADPVVFGGIYYDPRIVYDTAADRWLIAAIYNDFFNHYAIVLAVSAGGDPAAGWSRYRVDSNVPGGFTDFTRLGMTSDRFVVSINYNGGSSIFTFMKSDLYAGSNSYKQITTPGLLDLQPVTFVDGSGTVAYLLRNTTSDTEGALDVYMADGTVLQQVAHLTSAPWERSNPRIAPQLGSSKPMDIGDESLQGAVARHDVVTAVHPIVTSAGGPRRSAIRWWSVDLASLHAKSGTIDDPSGATFYGFPSVAVNRQDGMLIGYCVYSAQIHPSIGFSYRDRIGAMSATEIISTGTAVPSQQRWGDYTTTVVDPANDLDFWTTAPSATSTIWSTWWGQLRITTLPGRVRAVRH